MDLHPHQHNALVALLRSPEWAALSADEAFAQLSADKNLGGLRTARFIGASKLRRLQDALGKGRVSPKAIARIGDRAMVVEDAEFPGGVPGYPNVMRRPHFDKAFAEARS
jgi:hypothetical protein